MTTEFVFRANDEVATDQLGAALANIARPGLVIGLIGPLGAGKTRLVRSTATALGADPSIVNSPTFVLIQEYDGRIPVYHFDTYRLRDAAAFADLGADEYFSGDGICFVEWSNRVAGHLPSDRLEIRIEVLGETTREFHFTATGPTARSLLERLVDCTR